MRKPDTKPEINEVEGRNILYKVNEAMAQYHAKNIVHRDLHSMNIMIHFDDLKPGEEDLLGTEFDKSSNRHRKAIKQMAQWRFE